MTFRLKAATAIVLATFSAHSYAQERPSSFYVDVTATNVPLAPDMHGIDAAMIDVDGDRDLDVIVAVEHGPNALYLNDGKGKLTWKPNVFETTPRDTEHVEVGDFNQDGHMDVIFVAEADEMHALYFGDGKGGFVNRTNRLPRMSQGNAVAVVPGYAVGRSWSMAQGDLDGDKKDDIFIGGWRSQTRLLLTNTLVAKPTSLRSTPYIIQGR
ncbi:FG-GAP repeat domain-containing protein [Achromobacter spanius]|uniref:FG-GAP repeat domain-containing protein n=1 Tax=Achromobacter spanius TaxID=217203 RepID=UPI0036E219D1